MMLDDPIVLDCGHTIAFCDNAGEGSDLVLAHQKTELVRGSYNQWLMAWADWRPLRVLEVGVCRGGSLALWHELWNCEVVGIDKDLTKVTDACRLHYSHCCDSVISLVQATMPDRAVKALDFFDLIIDDGEHGPENIIPTLELLWSQLHRKGFYVIEDWQHDWLQPQETARLAREFVLSQGGSMLSFQAILVLEKGNRP